MPDTPNLEAIGAAALVYRRRKWSVLPVKADKTPAGRGWKALQSVPANEATVEGWFAPNALRGTVAGVGIVTGDVSGGLVVRDFDEPGSYERWAAAHPDLAAQLPTVKTWRGFHVYARAPGCRTRTYSDGELRAEGVYVVAPPSPHANGTTYRWINRLPDGPLREVDPSVFDPLPDTGDRGPALRSPIPSESMEGESESPKCSPIAPIWPESPVILGIPESLGSPAPLAPLVLHFALGRFIVGAIKATVPAGVGKRNCGVFRLARRLKAHPMLANRPAFDLNKVVQRWHRAVLPIVGTRDFDATWADFIHAWGRVTVPFGQALADALEVARNAPDPVCCAGFDSAETRLLIRLCRELQRRAGDRPFFLTGVVAGGAVGLEPSTAHRRLGMLVACGVLRLERKGHTGRASEYRFIGT